MPNFVELTLVETEPGIKGDTATGAPKVQLRKPGQPSRYLLLKPVIKSESIPVPGVHGTSKGIRID